MSNKLTVINNQNNIIAHKRHRSRLPLHRTAKQAKLELPFAVKAAPKVRKTAAASRENLRPARKTPTKARKVA
jgi:hypothetical protein